MGLPWSALKYVLLVGLIAALLYTRMLLGRRRPREPHGRDRWRADFRQRHRDRLAAAGTWEERRRIQQAWAGPRRIRFPVEPGGAAGKPGDSTAERSDAKPTGPQRNACAGDPGRSASGGAPQRADPSARGGQSGEGARQ